MKRDIQATEAKNFQDPRSYVAKDGREILYGKDWAERKWQVWMRGNGKCERMVEPNVRCRNEMAEPHHKVKRSKLRDDRMSNLEGLCHLHHDILDPRKPRWSKHEQKAAS